MIKISKYLEAIGKWEHTIGNITHILEPQEDDNYLFLRAKVEAEKKDNQEILFKRIGELYFAMVLRSYPALSDEDQKELRKWIGVNINQIIQDFLIAFHWTTKEKMDEIEKGQKKNKIIED